MLSKNDLDKIKVEISLADLAELQEKAKLYYFLYEENERLKTELYSKKNEQ